MRFSTLLVYIIPHPVWSVPQNLHSNAFSSSKHFHISLQSPVQQEIARSLCFDELGLIYKEDIKIICLSTVKEMFKKKKKILTFNYRPMKGRQRGVCGNEPCDFSPPQNCLSEWMRYTHWASHSHGSFSTLFYVDEWWFHEYLYLICLAKNE